MTILLQNLTIRPDSVQALYASYLAGGFLVNRRYQRKLVWTIEEKRAFVNSLKNAYPVPLFLFAEVASGAGSVFEIMDGMQRLNAIFSFLEGEFDLDGAYFDLDSIPETKQLLDQQSVRQQEPKLAAADCRKIVTYQVPMSIARNKSEDEIDEIFRRINSHGKHLSRQELRQAGCTTNFASLVRKTAARIRGDASATDRLDLANMKKISITNKQLPYGLDVHKLFWAENKILTGDQLRESRDEELIGDIFGYILLEPKPPSNTNVLDEYYGTFETEDGKERHTSLEHAVQKHGEARLIASYIRVHDELRTILSEAGKPFNQLMFEKAGARVPRYFQVIFLALYDLLIKDGLRVNSLKQLAKLLDGIGEKNLQISEGGKWAAVEREKNVNAIKGIIRKSFKKAKEVDPATESWATEFENVLTQSATENSLYDFKQGLHRAEASHPFEEAVIDGAVESLAAMVNTGPGVTGYVIIGVTDDSRTAARLSQLYKVQPKTFRNFHVFGVDHEARLPQYRKGLDSYFQLVQQRIKQAQLTPAYRDQILKDMRMFQYFDRHILLLKVSSLDEPCAYQGAYSQRSGAHVDLLQGESLKHLFRRFYGQG